jgi:hypothetical protein
MNDFLHTWELDENSWLIRFYDFWYDHPSHDTLSFCKLFWAVICAPLMGIMWLVILPVMKIVEWFSSRSEKSKPSKRKWSTANARSRKKSTAIASGVGSFFDRVSAFFQRHNWLGALAFWVPIVIAGVAVVGGSGYGIVRLVALIHGNLYWKVWWPIIEGLLIGAAVSGGVVVFHLFIVFGVNDGQGPRPWARSVGRFFATGYHAVKYRTCPRVVVKSKS